MTCNKCNSFSCKCGSFVQKPYFTDACQQQMGCKEKVYVCNFSAVLRIQGEWAVPAADEIVTLTVPGLTDILVGSVLWNPDYGAFEVVALPADEQIKIKKVIYSDVPDGTTVPSCTKFIVTAYSQIQEVNTLLPIGSVIPFAASNPPDGWLLCEGQEISREDYALLFAVIGTTYGAGDGVNTFDLPDMRQKFPLGVAGSGTGSTLGGTGGNIDHTHSVPAHHHAMGTGADLNITASGSHTHNLQNATNVMRNTGVSPILQAGASQEYSIGNTISADAATHTHASGDIAGKIGLVTGGVDGNAAMTSGTNNPPFLALNYIIWTGVQA